MKSHEGEVTTVSLSRDGRRVVSTCWTGLLESVCVWDVLDGRRLTLAGYPTPACAMAPDGKIFAVSDGWTHVSLLGADSGIESVLLERRAQRLLEASQLCFSSDGAWLAEALPDQVRVFDVRNGGLNRVLRRGPKALTISCAAISADGRQVAAASRDGSVAVYDRAADGYVPRMKPDRAGVVAMAFTMDCSALVAVRTDGRLSS